MAHVEEIPPSLPESDHGRFDKWWRDVALRKLICWQTCILLAQMTTGYDESVVGSFQSMQPWVHSMGDPNASRIGLITATLFIGGFVGALVAPPISDRFGRRMGMLVGSGITFIGTVLQTAAQGYTMFVVGRLFVGLGISFTCVAGPTLLFELSHPSMRGYMSLLFNAFWYVGSIFAAWITFGTGHMSNSWAWRIPSLFQGVPSALVMLSVLCGLPESPRWLCAHDRIHEAQQMIATYHAKGDLDATIVEEQVGEIRAALEIEESARATKWSTILRSPANRKRLAIIVAIALLTLWNGQGIISYYFSPILTDIGISDTASQTGINGGLQIWNLISSLIGAYLAVKIGRRPLWLLSYITMIFSNVALTVATAMHSKHDSTPAGYAAVVSLFFYDAAFNLANNPLAYAYPTEILPFAIRARGLGLFILIGQAALTVNQYVNPIALDSIGYYFYIFYLGMLILGTTIIFATFPETKGLSEKELILLFESKEDTIIHDVEPEMALDQKNPMTKMSEITSAHSLSSKDISLEA